MIDILMEKITVFIEENGISRCQVIYISEDIPATVRINTPKALPKPTQEAFFKLVEEFFPFHIGRVGQLGFFSCWIYKHQFIEWSSSYKRMTPLQVELD